MRYKNPYAVIIILNWNKYSDTIQCLHSIYNMDYLHFSVLVIDNASDDGSVEKIKLEFPDLWLIANEENVGFTGGNNQGIELALSKGADYVWLLNNDTVVEVETLSSLVDAAEQSSDIGMASPAVNYYDSPHLAQFNGSKVDWDKLEIDIPGSADDMYEYTDGPNVCLWGTALLIKRELIEKIGYLNEGYFAYFEDTEYSLRALRAGFRNKVVLHTKILHKTPPPDNNNSIRNSYFYYYMIRNRYLMWKGLSGDKKYIFQMLCRHAISWAEKLKAAGKFEHSWDCIEGFYDAVTGVTGKKPLVRRVPPWCVGVFTWHPYLFLNLFSGNFRTVWAQLLAKLKF